MRLLNLRLKLCGCGEGRVIIRVASADSADRYIDCVACGCTEQLTPPLKVERIGGDLWACYR